jgi:predicted nucleic acid-binding protein
MSDLYVLDACALIALIKGENGGDSVWNALYRASIGDAAVHMHEINLLEVYYGLYHERGEAYAKGKATEATFLFTTVRGLSDAAFSEAGRLKATYRISLADSIALAHASVSGGMLLTADHHELDVVEQHERIHFSWIR